MKRVVNNIAQTINHDYSYEEVVNNFLICLLKPIIIMYTYLSLPPLPSPPLPSQLESRYKHLIEDQKKIIQREREEKESLVDKLQSAEQQLKSSRAKLGEVTTLLGRVDRSSLSINNKLASQIYQ